MTDADDPGTRRGGGAGDDPRLAQFLRGATMGALVGAAIAGSAIWRRRLARSTELAAGPSPHVTAGRAAPTGRPTGQAALDAPSTSERATSG
ncbi:MAG: hypothetical protein ACHQ3P_05295 [Candidatus Limnocylindrales bacterium]